MLMKFLGAAASTALLFGASQASAATLVIDSFSSPQWVQDSPTTDNPNQSVVADASVLGGSRALAVTNTAAVGDNTAATELRVNGGNLTFSNVAGAKGEGTLTYDGDNVAGNVNTTGLNENLLIGTDPYFFFELGTVPFDASADFEVRVWDMLGASAVYSELITVGFNPVLSFSNAAFSGIDFSQIGALQFFISSANTTISVDGALDSIQVRAGDIAPVPLPASALLLLCGVGGLSFLRRRKTA